MTLQVGVMGMLLVAIAPFLLVRDSVALVHKLGHPVFPSREMAKTAA